MDSRSWFRDVMSAEARWETAEKRARHKNIKTQCINTFFKKGDNGRKWRRM